VAGWRWLILSDQLTIRPYAGSDAWKRNALPWSNTSATSAEPPSTPSFSLRRESMPAPSIPSHSSSRGRTPATAGPSKAHRSREREASPEPIDTPASNRRSAASQRFPSPSLAPTQLQRLNPRTSSASSRAPTPSRSRQPTPPQPTRSHLPTPSPAPEASPLPPAPAPRRKSKAAAAANSRQTEIAELAATLQSHAEASAQIFKTLQDEIKRLQAEGGDASEKIEELASLASAPLPRTSSDDQARRAPPHRPIAERAHGRATPTAAHDVVVLESSPGVISTDDESGRLVVEHVRASGTGRGPQVPNFRVKASSSVTHGSSGKSNRMRFLFDVPAFDSYLGLSMHGNIVGWSKQKRDQVAQVLGPVHPNNALHTDAAVYSAESNTLVIGLYPAGKNLSAAGESPNAQVALVRPSRSSVCLVECFL
jgi:hypothetical protein